MKRGQEHDLNTRLLLAGKRFLYCPGDIYLWRSHDGARISSSGVPHYLHQVVHLRRVWEALARSDTNQPQAVRDAIGRYAYMGGLVRLRERRTAVSLWRFAKAIGARPQLPSRIYNLIIAALPAALARDFVCFIITAKRVTGFRHAEIRF